MRRLVYSLVSQGCSDAVAVAIQGYPDLMRQDLLRTSRLSFLGLTRFCSSSLSSAAGRVTRRFSCVPGARAVACPGMSLLLGAIEATPKHVQAPRGSEKLCAHTV